MGLFHNLHNMEQPLFTGLIMAYIKIQRAESKHEMIQFNSKDTAKVGLAVVEILKKLI
ncbi:hypothetical protein ATC1_131833 [Flexilinea flocculi]|uniref:Uncharacterized protein n=1 Tax=Flexilinea flocculi TaxID=1678840 RepID=A0A0S7BNV0_9CHLR|nr:hypothetical protein ATC1_131833 [Flexilinea flocculi]